MVDNLNSDLERWKLKAALAMEARDREKIANELYGRVLLASPDERTRILQWLQCASVSLDDVVVVSEAVSTQLQSVEVLEKELESNTQIEFAERDLRDSIKLKEETHKGLRHSILRLEQEIDELSKHVDQEK